MKENMISLATIDTAVYYPVKIPSTGKKTKFRPFSVREERAFLTAHESDDLSTMLHTLETIVRNCVKDCPKDLTTFDVEYLFIQLRAKSVGEVTEAVATCVHCGEKNPIQIKLADVKLINDGQNKNVKLGDRLSVTMRYPSIAEVAEMSTVTEGLEEKAVAASIESVFFDDQVFHVKEGDTKDIIEFIYNRTEAEMAKLTAFVDNAPSVRLETNYKCKKCGKDNSVVVERLVDFF